MRVNDVTATPYPIETSVVPTNCWDAATEWEPMLAYAFSAPCFVLFLYFLLPFRAFFRNTMPSAPSIFVFSFVHHRHIFNIFQLSPSTLLLRVVRPSPPRRRNTPHLSANLIITIMGTWFGPPITKSCSAACMQCIMRTARLLDCNCFVFPKGTPAGGADEAHCAKMTSYTISNMIPCH